MTTLTDQQRKARIAHLMPYITEIQAAMGLAHWHIIVYDEQHPHRPEVVAVVDPGDGQNMGELWLNDAALTEEPEDFRNTIVHELLHLHEAHWLQAVQELSGEFGKTTWNIWVAGFRREIEYMTDALSRVIAPFLPLPPTEPSGGGGES